MDNVILRDMAARTTGEPRAAEPLQFAGWVLDTAGRQLRTETGQTVHLTQAEFRLLELMASHPRQVITRDQLMGAAAGRPWAPLDRSVDVHISNLRRKLGPDPRQPSLIRTVRGAGYMLVPHRG